MINITSFTYVKPTLYKHVRGFIVSARKAQLILSYTDSEDLCRKTYNAYYILKKHSKHKLTEAYVSEICNSLVGCTFSNIVTLEIAILEKIK